MRTYSFSYVVKREDGELIFEFPSFPEIICTKMETEFIKLDEKQIHDFLHDAVITALQAIIHVREILPDVQNSATTIADGFVHLSVVEGMKLELYRVFCDNFGSAAEFARHLGEPATIISRIFNLRHNSKVSDMEELLERCGKRLVANWSLKPVK